MGSVSLNIGDGTARFRRSSLCSSALHLLMLSSLIFTNLFAFYSFTSSPSPSSSSSPNISLISSQLSLITHQIHSSNHHNPLDIFSSLDFSSLPPDLHLFLSPHPLPLGRDSRSNLTHMLSSVGHPCARPPSLDLLTTFMSYTPFSNCPNSDNLIVQKLLNKGCEPVPRRRCLTPSTYLTSNANANANALWNPGRPNPGAGLYGVDKFMWVKGKGKNDFTIDEVLALGAGGIRIGFDIAGGAGNFAARMAERNVVIVTSTVEVGGKAVNAFVAARGLFPLYLSTGHRFPFYDGVFDLVHVMNGLDEGGVPALGHAGSVEALEFLMFDIDRVLRVGGLFWIDNYLCVSNERKNVVTRLIERFGYKKLKWVVGEKAEGAGNSKTQVYLSAVLQKPARA